MHSVYRGDSFGNLPARLTLGTCAEEGIDDELGEIAEGPERDAMIKRFAEEIEVERQKVLAAGGLFVLVDNYAPDEPGLQRFINEVETLRDPSHVRNHTVAGWSGLLKQAGLGTTVDSDTAVTKLVTENWLERSQTPPDRAEEVRRRLRTAPSSAIAAFRITPETFAVRKLILIGHR